MALEIEKLLDETGWLLLQELQQNARLSYTDLGQRVGLTSPAVADRIRRMEEAGIIAGYHAEVNLAKLGLPVVAMIRLGNIGGQSCQLVAPKVSEIAGVLECYRVIGDDSLIVKVAALSMDHMTYIIDQLSRYGIPTTSMVRPKTVKREAITRAMLDEAEAWEDRSS